MRAGRSPGTSLHDVAEGSASWIAFRRGGLRLVLAVAAVAALLVRAYGTPILTEAWNPYLPVMWWLVFVLAVWSIVSDGPPMLPVAVFAGSFCMQTHLPYLGLAAGLLAGAVAFAFARACRGRRAEPGGLPRRGTWTLLAAAAGSAL